MTNGNGNNGNGKKQALPPTPAQRVQTQVIELQRAIAHLRTEVQALYDAQDERADKFAAMFETGMLRVSDSINNQARNAIDIAGGFTAETIRALSDITRALTNIADKRIPDTAGHLVTALHGVATSIDALEKQ